MSKARKTCFLITPIGQAGSPIRARADAVHSRLAHHILDPNGVDVVRGDHINQQGSILFQVVKEILDAALVVVDLTGLNPNVLYELGIADAFQKPVIRLTDAPGALPFDLRDGRAITLRSSGDETLVEEDWRKAMPVIARLLVDALQWNHRVVDTVAQAHGDLPKAFGEAGYMRMIGGYELADGWAGVEKALRCAGIDPSEFRSRRPQEAYPQQFRVGLVGALSSSTAELRLSFRDWTEDEVNEYMRELVDVLIDCGSPYGVAAECCGKRQSVECGKPWPSPAISRPRVPPIPETGELQ
jgi:hypothetical protein